MLHINHLKKQLKSITHLWLIILISITTSNQNTIVIKEVNFTYDNQNPSFDISIQKLNKENKTEIKSINMRLNSFREVFRNNLTSQKFETFPKMFLTDNQTDYEEQKIKCNKINLQSNNFLSYNSTNLIDIDKAYDDSLNLTTTKAAVLEVQYFLFKETGWIDDNTNYVRPGNLMIEINIFNYTFCEDLVNSYNSFPKNTSLMKSFDINDFPNCKGYWEKDDLTGKINIIDNKILNISNQNWKNKSYFEMEFELNTNDDTNYVYDQNEVLKLKTNNSYVRLYQGIMLDNEDAYMEDNYPSVNWSLDKKKVVLQIPKFAKKATAWIFVDMNYMEPPENFKNFSTIAFFILLAGAIGIIAYILIRRKKMKEQLIMEEKLHNLSNV